MDRFFYCCKIYFFIFFAGGTVVFNRTRVLAMEGEIAGLCVMLQSASLDRELLLELQTIPDTATGTSMHLDKRSGSTCGIEMKK